MSQTLPKRSARDFLFHVILTISYLQPRTIQTSSLPTDSSQPLFKQIKICLLLSIILVVWYFRVRAHLLSFFALRPPSQWFLSAVTQISQSSFWSLSWAFWRANDWVTKIKNHKTGGHQTFSRGTTLPPSKSPNPNPHFPRSLLRRFFLVPSTSLFS